MVDIKINNVDEPKLRVKDVPKGSFFLDSAGDLGYKNSEEETFVLSKSGQMGWMQMYLYHPNDVIKGLVTKLYVTVDLKKG